MWNSGRSIYSRDNEDLLVRLFYSVPWGPILFSYLSFADLVAMCVMYPTMLLILTSHRSDLENLRQRFDVRAAIGAIPSIHKLRMIIETFEPVDLISCCGPDENFDVNLLDSLGDSLRFELSFHIMSDSVRLFPHQFYTYSLSISLSVC